MRVLVVDAEDPIGEILAWRLHMAGLTVRAGVRDAGTLAGPPWGELRALLGRQPRTLSAYLEELLSTSYPNPALLGD